jgi:hypothetical protein
MMVREVHQELFPKVKWARLKPVSYFSFIGTPAMEAF